LHKVASQVAKVEARVDQAIEQFGMPVANQAVQTMQQILADPEMIVYTKIFECYRVLAQCHCDLTRIANAVYEQRRAGAIKPMSLNTRIVAMPWSLAR
jgi:hypothetical protein